MKKFSIRTSRLLAGAAVAAAALFAACTADTEDVPVRVPLRFAVSMPEDWDDPDAARSAADKALPTRAESIAEIESFGVFAYVESLTDATQHALYLNNVEVKRQTDGTYAPDENYYLRGGMKTIFFAYSPYDETLTSASVTYDVMNGKKDLLIATGSVEANSSDATVSLTFSHALSKVTFMASETETSYLTFTLSIATTGTLVPEFAQDESDTPKWTWNPTSTPEGTAFPGTLDTEYFMIPQSVEGKTIELTEADKTGTLTGTLTVDWKPNNQYTYTFDLSSTSSGGS